MKQDILQIRQLLDQCSRVAPHALKEGSLDRENWANIAALLAQVEESIMPSETALINGAQLLEQALDIIEK